MDYDLLVIGGGSGGLAASRRAAFKYGKRVCLVEKGDLGGTCVNKGCIPKKMLYNAASLFKESLFLSEQSQQEAPKFHWKAFLEKRTKYISFLHSIYENRNRKDQVEIIKGEAALEADRRVLVNGKEYTAERIIVATGSFPRLPNIPGKESAITSDDFFEFEEIPSSVVILGAGYIAVECAFVLSTLGCKVIMINRSKGVLRAFDSLIGESVEETLKQAGVVLYDQAEVLRIEDEGKCIYFKYNNQEKMQVAEKILSAIGREPDTRAVHSLSLSKKNGFLNTSEHFETCKKWLFAIGDVAMEEHMLTPVAIFTARRLIDHLYLKNFAKLKNLICWVPTVIFTHPPSGSVGCSEKESQNRYGDVLVKEVKFIHPTEFIHHGSSSKQNKQYTYNRYKFIYGETTKDIYGMHMHGHGCDEELQGFSVLIRNRIPFSRITECLEKSCISWKDLLMGRFE
ncbi:glutathione reductase (NADPH) [Nematocida sp. LUAm3]|nr:glutathione reductase (NADPH) [Nematocida sp. LUAm3]KAI5174926.1 glutathione reductase (NADPH) [Nematocida sp. LUAm2]KAI5177475.1 glutathione reductase (NADPH) [Nematocida sp. LUAm1]